MTEPLNLDLDPFMPKERHVTRPPGTSHCAHTPTGKTTDDCGKPATWHVMWDTTYANSLTCDEHMALIQQRWMYDDRHPVGADCNMPGAMWLYREKCCRVPSEPVATACHCAAEGV